MKCIFENFYIKNPQDNKYIILYNAQSLLVVLKNITFPLTKNSLDKPPFNLTKPLMPDKNFRIGFTKQKFIFKLPIYQHAPLIGTNICEEHSLIVLDKINEEDILDEFDVEFDMLISAQKYSHIWKGGKDFNVYTGVKMKFNEMHSFLMTSPSRFLRLMYPLLEPGKERITDIVKDATNFLKTVSRQTPLEGEETHYNLLIQNPHITIGTGTNLEISFHFNPDTFLQISEFMWELANTHPEFNQDLLGVTYQDGVARPELISPEFFIFSMICLSEGVMIVLLKDKELLYNLKQQIVNYRILYVYMKEEGLYVLA